MKIPFTLNGQTIEVETAPDRRVIDLLREDLGLTGAKEGCGAGECGACAVLLDGTVRLSCLLLAAQLDGRALVTIEGLAASTAAGPLIDAFVAAGAVQCGYCTPGMVVSAYGFLENADPALLRREDIRVALSGNLCRCTGYQKIVDAVEQAVAAEEKA